MPTLTQSRPPSDRAIDRAEELLRQMTIEDKAMQLSSVFPLALFDAKGTNQRQLDILPKNGIGHVSALGLIGHKTPEALARAVNAIQHYLMTFKAFPPRQKAATFTIDQAMEAMQSVASGAGH